MRLPRFLLAGVLLFAALFLLTSLFVRPPFEGVGVTAAAVFLVVWLVVSMVNAWLGVVSAGYRPAEEALALIPVFGVPAVVAGLGALGSAALWDGGPVIQTGRAPAVFAAGLALWGAILLLAGLLARRPSPARSAATAAAVHLPLWALLCLVNLVTGVRAAGYTVAEEVPLFLLNVAVPGIVAMAAWALVRRVAA
ncbi:hypothetical protein [Planotetraspora kaengkrachanensis]|uniref:Uncharacterized protein n=1 Tax=Planotetraspora kaengkrachanensis TaxID=575193 RepID=A0A8J3LQG6_9ACTN|nr:hypothetical protein [Planotetraspora kaengkrachanensis]GIG77363.1 hypothetical protein Pka01_04900 [Planotetraspora kaengkrachanensis]